MAVFTPGATSNGINFDTDFGLLQLLLNQANYQNKQPGSFYVDAGDFFTNQLTVSGSFNHIGVTTGTITSLTFNDVVWMQLFTVGGLNLSLGALTSALAGGIQEAMELIFQGADTIQGTTSADYLAGYAGVDTIYGNQGNDTIHGNSGSDYLYGGEHNDTLYGDSEVDYLYGGSENDTLYGGSGLDDLDGGSGSDTVDYSQTALPIVVTLAGANFATVQALGIATDRIKNIENVKGGSLADLITGDGAVNMLKGNGGGDTLRGGGSNDDLHGDAGEDKLFGDSGNDKINGGANKDTIDGGAGVDTATYTEKSGAVSVTLNGATVATVFISGVAEDTIRNVENLTGGSGADTFTGDALANILSGGSGHDSLYGRLGNDALSGGIGNDTLIGGVGIDVLTGGAGADKFVFDVKVKKVNADIIKDFDALDALVFDGGVFKTGKSGVLKSKFFTVGKKAKDGTDYFIFNKKTDELYFDKDGKGGKAQKLVASFDTDVNLTASDILMI